MSKLYFSDFGDMPKKREELHTPPSGQPISRFPACQFTLSENIGALGVVPLFMGNSIAAMPARYVTHTVSNVRFTSRG